jgi:MFS family permease
VINRQFRLLFAGQAVSVVGDALFPVALAFAVLDDLDGTPAQLGIVLAAQTLPMAVLILASGVWADRLNRRNVMIVSDLGRATVQATLAILLISGSAELWQMIVLVAIYGTFEAGFAPAAGGLVPDVAGREHLQQANAMLGLARNTGMVLGPTLGGLLIVVAGPGTAIAIDAATFVGSAAFLIKLRLPRQAAREASSFLRDLRDGWTAFRSRAWVWSIVAAASLGNLLWASVGVLGPVIAERDLGGAAVWGTVLAAMGVGALVGGLIAIRAHPRRPLVLSLCVLTLFSLPPALLALGAHIAVLAAGTFLAGAGMMLGISLYESTFQRVIPPEVLSRVSSYDWFGSVALQPVGLVIWGPIAAVIGIHEALWVAAILLFTSILAPLLVREVRTMPGV